MKIGNTLAATAIIGCATLASATPRVSNVRMEQSIGSRKVTIKYRLTEPAVVTLDVFTNAVPYAAEGWASIGGEAVCTAQGAVWRKVTSADAVGGDYTITWRPDQTWRDENGNCLNVDDGCAKAVVTAWALDNTPDYMVVDISVGAQPNTQRYYPAVDFLPGSEPGQRGAITNNSVYKTSMLVMRKIMAKDVVWTMGSSAQETDRHKYGRENTHQLSLTNNYYIAVFETTQAQWSLVSSKRPNPSYFNNAAYKAYRPVEQVCYNEIRMADDSTSANGGAEEWPGRPYPGSFLALLSDRTGIDFDLPTEAQWEFAARAGHGSPYWNDGSAILGGKNDANLSLLGRYVYNGGWLNSATTVSAQNCDTANGTAAVGSYPPNSWGLYDMHGNVCEWCIDWFRDVLTAENGWFPADDHGTPVAIGDRTHEERTVRGGSFGGLTNEARDSFGNAGNCRPAYRQKKGPQYRESYIGFRVVCPADFTN